MNDEIFSILSSDVPSPNQLYPIKNNKKIIFLKNIITLPNITVGDYTGHAAENPLLFERNILHNYLYDKIIIGKFCGITENVRFFMNAINHNSTDCFTSYPFMHFDGIWKKERWNDEDCKNRGDIIIGNDVLVGRDSSILPGVKIGDGAVIGACSVVTKNVEPYTVVAGNPAKFIKKRLDDQSIEILLKIKWWDWDINLITKAISVLKSKNAEKLKNLAKETGYF